MSMMKIRFPLLTLSEEDLLYPYLIRQRRFYRDIVLDVSEEAYLPFQVDLKGVIKQKASVIRSKIGLGLNDHGKDE